MQRLRASQLRKLRRKGHVLGPDDMLWLAWYERTAVKRGRTPREPEPGIPEEEQEELEDEPDMPDPEPQEPTIMSQADSADWALSNGVMAMRASADLMQAACASWERLANASTERLLATEQQLVDALTALSGMTEPVREAEAKHPADDVTQRLTGEMLGRMFPGNHPQPEPEPQKH